MPAYDVFHDAVKTALIKDNWVITHDPFSLSVGDVDFYIDLGAESLLAAERGDKCIAVEIKSFLSNSLVSEFHTALGQFLNYKLALLEAKQIRELYLAVTDDVYQVFFSKPFIQSALKHHQIKVLVFNPELQEIVLWIK
ncbi:MAG: hypothetical protein RLZZ215_3009 [Pseudomonadota bacterium]|jgi:hypothetical protein